jgi:branched-chain amino acid transport system permease protein
LTRSFIGGSGRGVDLIVYGGLIVLISLARPQGLIGLFPLVARQLAQLFALVARRRKAIAS